MRTCRAVFSLSILTFLPTVTAGQSLPIIPAVVSASSTPQVEPASSTGPVAHLFKLFPLAKADTDAVKAFYGTDAFSGANQVEFLYGFGVARKTLRAELASLLFPRGVRVSLSAAMTADDETPASALEGMQSGGDASLRVLYPVALARTENSLLYAIAMTDVAFAFDGPGKAQTITESKQWSGDVLVEGYGEWTAIDGVGKFFASGRLGRQRVSPEFAREASLARNNFWAAQVALGLEFAGNIRISLQRTRRPEVTGATAESGQAKWRLAVQFSPTK